MKLKKVLTVDNILNQQIERIPWGGEWYQAYGNPQAKGVWFVWGQSGTGKSAYIMQLCRQLANYYKVWYNPLEQGTDDENFIKHTDIFGMHEVKHNFHAQRYNYEETMEYLSKRNAPKVGVIDSIKYLTRKFEEYEEMVRRHRNMIWIISGHAAGSNPKSSMEEDIMYDAYQKVRTDAYAAYCKSRSVGPNGGQYIIYQEKYESLLGAES